MAHDCQDQSGWPALELSWVLESTRARVYVARFNGNLKARWQKEPVDPVRRAGQ